MKYDEMIVKMYPVTLIVDTQMSRLHGGELNVIYYVQEGCERK